LVRGRYADRPPSQPHDWTDAVRSGDVGFAGDDELFEFADEGGLQQQRSPGFPNLAEAKPQDLDPALVELEMDDDPAADQRVMDHARGLGDVARGYGLNETDHDLVPGF
jgi:type IV secretion system protein VirD4